MTPDRGRNDLPDPTAQAARDAGLLTDAMKRQRAADALLLIADCVAEAGIAAMPTDEIVAEVKAARAEQRRRASVS